MKPIENAATKDFGKNCVHRGEVIRTESADLCGIRGVEIPIFSCSVHGECSARRYCQKQVVQSCVLCEERLISRQPCDSDLLDCRTAD